MSNDVHEPQWPGAVATRLDRGVRPLAGPNLRRMLRAARMCEELGHAGDTLAALEELKALREVLPRLVAGIDHLDKLAREWEPDHSSGADRRGWVLAKDARDDAARFLRPNVGVEPHAPEQA